MKLTIELVPSTAWYSNVRSNVSKEEWDKIRKKSYSKANHKCEICGDVGTNQGVKHNVECHKTKHAGLASIKGETPIVINQLMKVNEITETEAIAYMQEAFRIHANRSQFQWKLDISYLDEYTVESDNWWENY